MRVATPNDPKLSDSGVRRGTCMVGGKVAVEAGAVTHGAVRCSAWLGDVVTDGVQLMPNIMCARFELVVEYLFLLRDAKVAIVTDAAGRELDKPAAAALVLRIHDPLSE